MRTLYIILVKPLPCFRGDYPDTGQIFQNQKLCTDKPSPSKNPICYVVAYIDDFEGCWVNTLGLFHDPRPDLFVEEVVPAERVLEHEVDHL